MKPPSLLSRRDLIRQAAAGGALLAGASLASASLAGCSTPGSTAPPSAPPEPTPAPTPPLAEKTARRILILGGTGFVGPALVEAAQKRGHTLTLFNRGKTNPALFPDVEKLHGDRDGKLDALAGRRWDAVIDTSGYVPRVVKMSADLLAAAVDQYVFISTISVYAGFATVNMDEAAPVAPLADPTSEDVTKDYGALKALCEKTVEASLPGRALVIRPGLIVGPRDQSGRFTYWPTRIARGGEVLAPGTGADPIQYIDVRDLAEWTIHMVEEKAAGTYNALGPAGRLEMSAFLAQIQAAIPGDTRLTWVPADFLDKEGIHPWSDMPVWLPVTGEFAGAGTISNARATAKGLTFRPVADSATATLEWVRSLEEAERTEVTQGAGLKAEKEAQVLARWHARAKKARP